MDYRVPVFVFSGTGNTQRAAEVLVCEGKDEGYDFELVSLDQALLKKLSSYSLDGLFGVMYPIMGGGSPRIIHQWANALPQGSGQTCFFLLSSAGAEHTLNKGAANSIIRILKAKGYRVDYVRVLGMGSNWLYSYPDDFVRQLAACLPEKCRSVVKALKSGIVRNPGGNPVVNALIEPMAFMEDQFGARVWGRFLKTDDSCTGCGVCAKQCGIGNITMTDAGTPVFGWSCQWCMKCVYRCPAGSIRPRFFKSAVLKEGYNLKTILKQSDTADDSKRIRALRKNFATYLVDPEV